MPAQIIRVGLNLDPVIAMVHSAPLQWAPRVPSQLPKEASYYGIGFVKDKRIPKGNPNRLDYAFARLSLTTGCDSWGDDDDQRDSNHLVGRVFPDIHELRLFILNERLSRLRQVADA